MNLGAAPLRYSMRDSCRNTRNPLRTRPARRLLGNNQEPDILVIDNYGMIDGITTPLGDFTGIGSSGKIRQGLVKVSESLSALEGPKRGWEFLMQTSKNHEA